MPTNFQDELQELTALNLLSRKGISAFLQLTYKKWDNLQTGMLFLCLILDNILYLDTAVT